MSWHVIYEIGSGDRISMWYDKWNQHGPLCDIISKRARYEARLDDNLKVSEMIVNRKWVWPDGWEDRFPVLKDLGIPDLTNKEDKVMWLTNNSQTVMFLLNKPGLT
ncbi:RNA-directed DNA polymerase, eukaryota, Reverse transcriptase zinc-binding domain protein [Artemisia annua]|uniref:RNA-directed DNA polymerase, eukaryota, Reverse transcriptase zinc-binding domain protein n=1 Tax=Artemisia annua TaxID=35608 RepID=A0A2U1MTC4_ARTAN|nr:RNA-directed DNA polymerase, eukaryota, Reverse transcriptase zinc-binding domain protein [Artemisia annua]